MPVVMYAEAKWKVVLVELNDHVARLVPVMALSKVATCLMHVTFKSNHVCLFKVT